ncbi:Sodium/hydrogen exchanger family-domain-containing protein, partial [Halteromyces radiatus]|uniref:Sodium/hydrogen exchanger family-domain-containing protein n=1 Tax=Halteromyces radiatus TaxID=101107 RepID=UPI00221EB637
MDHIFPTQSLPFINLIATIGLVFFLFQVGLEVDVRLIRRDWKRSLAVAVAGMALPFALGVAVSLGLYRLQNDSSVPFGSFLLFLGVAVAITAFPVLARILAELKLLGTKVGAITMAAGLLNDCTAWVLLALVVALLNSTGGLEALYVFLTTVAFALFLIFLVGPLYYKLCVFTNSFENGPTHLLMTVTLMIVFVSAFVTDIIGVHPIFGGFLAGVIIPHESNLPIRITEKIEDIINILFLPLYFTLSGLKTQIGLLNSGTVWGYVILVIFISCFGKITGCTLAARLSGMTTRESFTVGFLMNCKGLVELIVLNIGHDAGVLNDQVFVIMVVMALVTTIMTTPFVIKLYPEWYQKQQAALASDGEFSTTGSDIGKVDVATTSYTPPTLSGKMDDDRFTMVTVLNRMETVPAVMALIRLLKRDDDIVKSSPHIHALRLLELTQRPSDVMKIQEMRETLRIDPVLSVIRTFASLIGIRLTTSLDFAAPTDFVKRISDRSVLVDANMVLLPWKSKNATPNESTLSEEVNPFDRPATSSSGLYQLSDAEFATHAFTIDHCAVGLFLDRGFGNIRDDDNVRLQHATTFQIVVPFVGGKDDRAAVLFALRLQMYRHADVLILRQNSSTNNSNHHQDNDEKDIGDGNIRSTYATTNSIRTCLMMTSDDDKQLLDTLFPLTSENVLSTTTSNVTCRFTDDISAWSLLRTGNPLGKHDLIVLGRKPDSAPHSLPTSPMDTPGTVYSKEFKIALGSLAFDLVSSGSKASLVVIQAPSNPP